jgi:hypothetical protein
MIKFDFTAPAEVFATSGRQGRSQPMVYRKFLTGAEAVKHVMESLDGYSQKSAIVETDDARFSAVDIAAIYESVSYPLPRKPRSRAAT